MHSAQIYDEVETLLGEDGPSTEAFLSLTYAQRVAVLMLSRGAKHTAVAIELKRSVRTLQYWMTSPDFRQALHEATSSLLREASALLHSKLGKAIDRLERIAQDPAEPASARVAANKALVTLALRMDNTIGRDEQIQCLREEQQQVLAALHAQNSAHTGKNTKKPENPTEPTSLERSTAVQSGPGAPAGCVSVPYVPTIPDAPYATASADRAQPTPTPPPSASPFRSSACPDHSGSFKSFPTFPARESKEMSPIEEAV